MPTGLTSVQVVNEALQQIASQTKITALDDGSAAANYANVVYDPTVQLLLREIEPDFARITKSLSLWFGTAPPPWAFQYLYPQDCVRLRQIRPSSLSDPNDPYPIRANVAIVEAADPVVKGILTNQPDALAVYTTSNVTEVQWDATFTDTVVRRLANPLAMALSGRPDFAREILQQSAMMAQTTESIDEGGFRRRS